MEKINKKERDYYFDNAKFILILLVVMAHFLSPTKSRSNWVLTFWQIANTLHMPALIFISGYFAKGYINSDGSVKVNRIFKIFMYYSFAQITVWLFEYFVLKDTGISKSFLAARSSLWFLQCMIIWMLFLPVVTKVKTKAAIIISIVVGILSGYDAWVSGSLSFSRVLVHFPFYLIGYYFKKEWLLKLKTTRNRILSIIFMVAVIFLVYKLGRKIPNGIITCDKNYYSVKLPFEMSIYLRWILRVAFYLAASALFICLMIWVPVKKTFFSLWGSRTLQVYIGHRYIYLAELKYGWAALAVGKTGILIVALIAVATTVVLSLKPFEYPFKLVAKIRLPLKNKE